MAWDVAKILTESAQRVLPGEEVSAPIYSNCPYVPEPFWKSLHLGDGNDYYQFATTVLIGPRSKWNTTAPVMAHGYHFCASASKAAEYRRSDAIRFVPPMEKTIDGPGMRDLSRARIFPPRENVCAADRYDRKISIAVDAEWKTVDAFKILEKAGTDGVKEIKKALNDHAREMRRKGYVILKKYQKIIQEIWDMFDKDGMDIQAVIELIDTAPEYSKIRDDLLKMHMDIPELLDHAAFYEVEGAIVVQKKRPQETGSQAAQRAIRYYKKLLREQCRKVRVPVLMQFAWDVAGTKYVSIYRFQTQHGEHCPPQGFILGKSTLTYVPKLKDYITDIFSLIHRLGMPFAFPVPSDGKGNKNEHMQIQLVTHTGRVDVSLFQDFPKIAKNCITASGGIMSMSPYTFRYYPVVAETGHGDRVYSKKYISIHTTVRDIYALAGASLAKLGEDIGYQKLKNSLDDIEYDEDGAKKVIKHGIRHMDMVWKHAPHVAAEYAATDARITLDYASYYMQGIRAIKEETHANLDDWELPITAPNIAVRVAEAILGEYTQIEDDKERMQVLSGVKWDSRRTLQADVWKNLPEVKVPNSISAVMNAIINAYAGGLNSCMSPGLYNAERKLCNDLDLAGAYATAMSLVPDVDWGAPATVITGPVTKDTFPISYAFRMGAGLASWKAPEGARRGIVAIRDENNTGLITVKEAVREFTTSTQVYAMLQAGYQVYLEDFYIMQNKAYGYYSAYKNRAPLPHAKMEADIDIIDYLDHNPFAAISQYLVQKRNKYDKNSIENTLYKLIINSLYGKTGQGVSVSKIFSTVAMATEQMPISRITMPHVACYITAFIRTILALATIKAEEAGYTVASRTTDGFYTSAPMEDVESWSLYGLGDYFRTARRYVTNNPSATMWERKHTDPKDKTAKGSDGRIINPTTRANLDIDRDYGIDAKGSFYLSPYQRRTRVAQNLNYREELALQYIRWGHRRPLRHKKEAIPSVRDYLERGQFMSEKINISRVSWAWDQKHRIVAWQEVPVTIRGRTYTYYSAKTEDWLTKQEYTEARRRKRDHENRGDYSISQEYVTTASSQGAVAPSVMRGYIARCLQNPEGAPQITKDWKENEWRNAVMAVSGVHLIPSTYRNMTTRGGKRLTVQDAERVTRILEIYVDMRARLNHEPTPEEIRHASTPWEIEIAPQYEKISTSQKEQVIMGEITPSTATGTEKEQTPRDPRYDWDTKERAANRLEEELSKKKKTEKEKLKERITELRKVAQEDRRSLLQDVVGTAYTAGPNLTMTSQGRKQPIKEEASAALAAQAIKTFLGQDTSTWKPEIREKYMELLSLIAETTAPIAAVQSQERSDIMNTDTATG